MKKEKPQYGIWQNLCFMVSTAWDTRKQVLFMCTAIAMVQVGLDAVQLFLTPEILKKVENGATVSQLLGTIGIFSAVLFFLSGAKIYLKENRLPAETDVRVAVSLKITRKTCETSYPNIRDPKVLKLKEQARNATSNNRAAAEHIWTTLTQILTNVGGFMIYLALLTNLNGFLVPVVMVTAAVGFFVSRYIHEWEYRHREEKAQFEKELDYVLWKPIDLAFAKDVRIFGLSPWLRELQSKAMKALEAFLSRRERFYIWANVTDCVMTLLRNGAAYVILIGQALRDGLPASEFLLYFAAVGGFAGWVKGILSNFLQLQKESISLSYVQEYLNYPEPFKFDDGLQPPKADGYELRLDNVTFRYPGAETNVLEHVNLVIRPGEKLAVVGLNGAGKTTLVKLLCGLYDPCEGAVLLNGQDIRSFNRRQYYALFSAVFQDFSILDSTIAQCVAQSVDGIDMEKVSTCLKQSGLAETVKQLPAGTQTHIGREVYLDGILLSGGQTQRLMLARALYKDGPILILDEPTAALDPIAENEIYLKYNEMTMGKTSVFISHRLASTRFCDRILFLADGGIAEEGSHYELMARNGAYAHLFEVQSRYYREGGERHEGD